MQLFPPTTVFRHRKENLKKCSLRGLEMRTDMRFFTYPLKSDPPDLQGYLMLSMDGPELCPEDADKGLLILDGTWRYATQMEKFVNQHYTIERRTLPSGWTTAYPRRQEDCPDPGRGLASIEAIFAAYRVLGRSTEGLLDDYYWKEKFLFMNRSFFSGF